MSKPLIPARIFRGRVTHTRLAPVRHDFSYPLYWYCFDLDRLPEVASRSVLFGHNALRPVAIHDTDYLTPEARPIKEKLLHFLTAANCRVPITRVELMTAARFFNYVFNPVNFYYCYLADGTIAYTVAEVYNTFKEKHLYVLDRDREARPGFAKRYTVDRAFHVSPFNEIEGQYDFYFSEISDKVDIRIDILRDDQPWFLARLRGEALTMNDPTILKTIVKFPLTAALSIPRIYWQAARLHFQKKLPIISKPHPSSEWTIGIAPATAWERFCVRFVRRFIRNLDNGNLEITYPDGSVETFGDPGSPTTAKLRLRNYSLFPRLVRDGGIGLGESFQAGDWETDDLAGVIYLLLNNAHCLPEAQLNLLKPFRWALRLEHGLRSNSLRNSRKNISAHYDLSNDFFGLFLDTTLTYSSARFASAEDTLQKAQENKMDSILAKAQIPEGGSLLEIGSGWGAMALRAQKQTNCRVTSISLSQEQLTVARERALQSGQADKIDFRLQDYRHTEGQFDRIVSIEMMEAVGKRYLGEFFATIEKLLKPNGVVVLQVIAYPDYDHAEYLKRQDWIQRHIFPGSHLPSLNSILQAVTNHSRLVVDSLENLAPHYALTLRHWQDNFSRKTDEVKALGFDQRFIRTWQFYLASCEAEFESRWLQLYQIVLTRPNNPGYRDVQPIGLRHG